MPPEHKTKTAGGLCWLWVSLVTLPTKELGEMKSLWMQKSCFPSICPVTATTWVWDLDIPSALNLVSLKGLERTRYWSLTKIETGRCSVNLEILCSESFKIRWCKIRGTSPSLGVEAVALLKSFISQWWGFKCCSGHVCFCTLTLCHPEVTACLGLPLPGTDACLVRRKPERQHGQWETGNAFYLRFSCMEHLKACLQEGVCALGEIQSTVRGEDWRRLIFAHGFLAHSQFQAPDIFFALQVMIYCSGFSNACRSLRKVGIFM